VINGTIPVEDFYSGECIYKELKEIFKAFDQNAILFGQITQPLEPCCKKTKETITNENHPKIS
jgi:hypothetical protein